MVTVSQDACLTKRPLFNMRLLLSFLLASCAGVHAQGNRLAYLDAVPGTRSWDIYRWGRVGRVKLSAGLQTLLVRSEGPVTVGALIDLREVRLVPAGSKGPGEGFDWPAFKKTNNE